MATEADYKEYISVKDQRGLLDLLPVIEDREPPADFGADGWDPGKGFEYLVLRAFELDLRGGSDTIIWPYDVSFGQLLGTAADTTRRAAEQIDGGVYLGGLACLLQSKTGNQVDYEPIAVLANQLRRRPSSVVGAVFSLHDFTPAALTLARFTAPQTVLLWQGAEFALALRNSVCVAGLVWKYRQAIELGIPDASLSDFDDITDLRRLNPVGGL